MNDPIQAFRDFRDELYDAAAQIKLRPESQATYNDLIRQGDKISRILGDYNGGEYVLMTEREHDTELRKHNFEVGSLEDDVWDLESSLRVARDDIRDLEYEKTTLTEKVDELKETIVDLSHEIAVYHESETGEEANG